MAGRLRTVFFGSSDFSIPTLRRLLAEHEVVAVCSQPARPAGRGLLLTATPVAKAAREAGATVLTPSRIDDPFIAQIASMRPALLACASYGKILPARLLAIAGMTALNVHPSLLPQYRGATPIQAALREGREETGVTVFWMDAGMDDGDIALAQSAKIDPNDNYGTLHDTLARMGADLMAEAAGLLSESRLERTPQRKEDATYTKPISKEDLRLRLDVAAQVAVNQIRSLSPKPGAWMMFEDKRLKVLEAIALDPHGVLRIEPDVGSPIHWRPNAPPGSILGFDERGPVIATSPGAICLTRVIPEGRPVMPGAEFAKRATKAR